MAETYPHIAIAILNYNGRHHLEKYLPSVTANTYPNQSLWIIDNASTDSSLEFLQIKYPHARLIRLHTNLGFAGGYNAGIQAIPHEYILLLNSDIEVDPGFLFPLAAQFHEHENMAFCQPKIRSLRHPEYFEFAGAGGGWIDRLGYPFCRGRIFENCEVDTGQYDEAAKIFWSSGAAMLIRKTVFEKLGGFYDFFFMHSEEIDLCWRAQKAGYSVGYFGDSTVYHLGAASLKKENPFKTYLNFRNNLVMLCRNSPLLTLLWLLPVRLGLDLAAAIQFLAKGDGAGAAAVIKAWMAFLKWLFNKDDSRWPKSLASNHPLSGVYNGSVVWQHFVLRKNTWRQIVPERTPAPFSES